LITDYIGVTDFPLLPVLGDLTDPEREVVDAARRRMTCEPPIAGGVRFVSGQLLSALASDVDLAVAAKLDGRRDSRG
jgi:hypothetical protein